MFYPEWMTTHAKTFVAVCELYGHAIIADDLADALSGDDNGARSLDYYFNFALDFLTR